MAVIEITCPHCSARTYVTFVRQTGNGSCPECGNEVINVFQFARSSSGGEGSLLTDNFSSSSATIISGGVGDGQDLFGDNIPVEPLPEVSGAALATESAPMLAPSLSGPTLVPMESAPMLVPSNSAPTLIPNDSSPPGKVEGMLLTPPPPRLRQFAAEEPAMAKAAPELDEINLEEVAPAAPVDESETRPRLPAIAFAPIGAPPQRPPTARVNKASAPVKRPTGNVAAAPVAPARVPTGRVQKPPTAPIQKSPTGPIAKPLPKRPTGAIAAPSAAVPAPTRRPTSPVPVRRPTAPLPSSAAPLAPGDEPSLLTPPLPPKGTRAVMPPAQRRPTSSLPKPATRTVPGSGGENSGRTYAPIRVPGGPITSPSTARPPVAPPSPPKRPTAKLSVVSLGEAPRLAPPEKPKDFGKPKFDPGLTRLGYTMPGSDASHFDGLPEPSPVPFGASLDDDEAPAAPPPPGPRPGTRAAMPKPAPKPPIDEYGDLDEFAAGLDAPAAAVSKANISEDWAPAGPNSGIAEKIDIPGDLDDVATDSAATTVPENQPADEDEEVGADFEAEAETRQLPQQEKPAPKSKARPKPQADEGPRPVYHARSRIDWDAVRYHAFVGLIYTICALALVAFCAGLYHVHVAPLF